LRAAVPPSSLARSCSPMILSIGLRLILVSAPSALTAVLPLTLHIISQFQPTVKTLYFLPPITSVLTTLNVLLFVVVWDDSRLASCSVVYADQSFLGSRTFILFIDTPLRLASLCNHYTMRSSTMSSLFCAITAESSPHP
jgi:predicted neutral ceramidase superfamily lipid hydrolase